MEELFDTVRPSIGVVALQSARRLALLPAALDGAVISFVLFVQLYSLLLRLSVHADEVLP